MRSTLARSASDPRNQREAATTGQGSLSRLIEPRGGTAFRFGPTLLVVVCAATFMLLLDVTIVVIALPTIQSGLHASFSDLQWVVDAYALTLASVLLTAGSLADRYGRRLLFTIGLMVFTLGSLLCGVAESPIMLILSRSSQGIGGAILFTSSLALLAQSFHGHEREMAFGIWGGITAIAVALGPVLGGGSRRESVGEASSW